MRTPSNHSPPSVAVAQRVGELQGSTHHCRIVEKDGSLLTSMKPGVEPRYFDEYAIAGFRSVDNDVPGQSSGVHKVPKWEPHAIGAGVVPGSKQGMPRTAEIVPILRANAM